MVMMMTMTIMMTTTTMMMMLCSAEVFTSHCRCSRKKATVRSTTVPSRGGK